MSPFARALLAGCALASALAAVPAFAAAPQVAPILTTPDAIDGRTYAQPRVARVTNVDLDLTPDFATRTVAGTATLDVLAAPGAKEIVLDALGLKIAKVTDEAGRALPWTLGDTDGQKGAPLTVQLNGAKRIVIAYAIPTRWRCSGCRRS